LNIAVRAARKAGDIIIRQLDRGPTLTVMSKAHNDFVSEVDHAAEQAIIAILRAAYPEHGILAEESGAQPGDDYLWFIDPLDGTTNFLHGFPQFAVSIAVSRRGQLYQGVVYDPLKQDLFTASRGQGAQLNGRRIRVSGLIHLDTALIGTGFPVKHREHIDTYVAQFRTLLESTAGLRRAGAASLDLAYVACGRLDGFWELGLSPWDIAAGALLIEEAGGLVTDVDGGVDFLRSGAIVAANPALLKNLLRSLRAAGPGRTNTG
ncbi:MAG: inositol monophosphatase, partial [Gammaproteobacteria bacterium]|nr:inositol monophosphatase [Gammaproteobacteria bacterium]